jgi:N-acyl homoserine lactone hydrolase
VDGDAEVVPGVTLLATPGHSPGHVSLLVRLRESGSILLAVDAISRERELETGVNGGAGDAEVARESARRLLEIAAEEGSLLVYGHDPAQRPTLRWAPHLYR